MAILGLGTASFLPGYGPASEARPDTQFLKDALDAGITYFDTASVYGGSESALGSLHRQLRDVGVRVATKIPPTTDCSHARASLMASLERLQTQVVDTVLAHSATGSTATEVADAFRSLESAGLCRAVGASTYGPADACAAATWSDVVQVEFSILNQSVVSRLEHGPRSGIEIVARSVLCKGLLTEAGWRLPTSTAAKSVLADLHALAHRWELDLESLAIRFALDTPMIDVVLVGAAGPAELASVLRAWHSKPLTHDQYEEVRSLDRSREHWVHPERWANGLPE